MKSLTLKLVRQQGGDIKDLGFDITWDNKDFKFVSSENLGLFDIAEASVAEEDNQLLIVAASNTGDPVSAEGDFIKLDFEFDGAEGDVNCEVENVSATDKNGDDIAIVNNIVNLEIESRWSIPGLLSRNLENDGRDSN